MLSVDIYISSILVLAYHVLKIMVFVTFFCKLSLIILFHSKFYCTIVYESNIQCLTQGRNLEMLWFMFLIYIIKEKCCEMMRAFVKNVVKREFANDLGVAFCFMRHVSTSPCQNDVLQLCL
jgi:hypothetical protein